MPPKQRITREMILESAFAMFCKEGMEVVNARSVAKALNCSTQPIFSYYSGMQELKTTLDLKAQDLFNSKVASTPKGDAWLTDVYAAFVSFARAYPHVYRHLYASACAEKSRMSAFETLGEELIAHVQQKEGVTKEQAVVLCKELAVYAVGLASANMLLDSGDDSARIARAYDVIRGAIA